MKLGYVLIHTKEQNQNIYVTPLHDLMSEFLYIDYAINLQANIL